MFKRENTVQLEITYKELQMLRRYLLIWRNKLLAQGHITDPVDELLVKLGGKVNRLTYIGCCLCNGRCSFIQKEG